MKPPFRHPSEALATAPDGTAAAEAERPAPPADLLLCGHHYRVSQPAIAASHATAEPLPGRSADVTAALLRN
jgi:hypothetical protein